MAKYEVIGKTEDGREKRRYPDGAIRDEKGRLIEQHPLGHTITKADARELLAKRDELAKQRAIEGMIEAVEESGISLSDRSGDEAWKYVVKHFVKTFMKSSNIRGLGEAFTKISLATGMGDRPEPEKKINIEAIWISEVEKLIELIKPPEKETVINLSNEPVPNID